VVLSCGSYHNVAFLSFPTRRSSDLGQYASITITFKEAYENSALPYQLKGRLAVKSTDWSGARWSIYGVGQGFSTGPGGEGIPSRSEEHTSELQSRENLVCRLLLEKK